MDAWAAGIIYLGRSRACPRPRDHQTRLPHPIDERVSLGGLSLDTSVVCRSSRPLPAEYLPAFRTECVRAACDFAQCEPRSCRTSAAGSACLILTIAT